MAELVGTHCCILSIKSVRTLSILIMQGLTVFTVINFPYSLISFLFFKVRVHRTVDPRMSMAFKTSNFLLFQYV